MRRSSRLEGRVHVKFNETAKEDGEDARGALENESEGKPPSLPPSNEAGDEGEGESGGCSDNSSSEGSKLKKRKVRAKGKEKANDTKRAKISRTAKDAKPPPTDPATWRESKVAESAIMTKGDAVKEYRLNPKEDFKDLKAMKRRTNAGFISLMYRTREVEHVAWIKHGSPEGFDYYIAKLKAQHEKKNANKSQKTEFAEPNPGADKFDVIAKKFKQEMASLEKDFPPWLWKYVTSHCDKTLLRSEDAVGGYDLQDMSEILQKIRVAKKQNLQDDYPRRPTELAPDSSSFKALKDLLDNAPGLQKFDWYDPPEYIWTYEDPVSGDFSHGWKNSFEDEVNKAVEAVVAEHGEEYKLHALWMVYDTHVQCIGGPEYLPSSFWHDEAKRVFDGPLKSQEP